MITTVLFDLDGTLLPMEQEKFIASYFGRLSRRLAPRGYDPKALIAAIWKGTEAMVRNGGEKTNEEVFWDTFCEILGEEARADMPLFDEFYREEFDQVRESCGHNPKAAPTVEEIRRMGFTTALATNPVFPSIATEKRCAWAGLDAHSFALYTTYENSSACKPNLDYYRGILARLGVKAEECLMVGNDVGEDMIAESLGMKVFLMTECLINKKEADISRYPRGGFEELLDYVRALRGESV